MPNRNVFFLALILAVGLSVWNLTGLGGTPPVEPFHYSSQVGIVDQDGNGKPCLEIRNAKLKPGTRVTVVVMDIGPDRQTLAEAEILEQPCYDKRPSGWGKGTRYAMRSVHGKLEHHLGFGIVGAKEKLKTSGNVVVADMDEDGKTERFSLCTSNEGLHLHIWSGEPYIGIRLWHAYYYLGYEVMPNCPEFPSKSPVFLKEPHFP
jgi:hypothetical protein